MKNKRFGINVKKWCREYERHIESALCDTREKEALKELLRMHEKRLSYLMHERLIHLIVTFIVTVLVLFFLYLTVSVPEIFPASAILFFISFMLLAFYVYHYFFLENTVQHWYEIDRQIEEKITSCKDF